MQARRRLVLTAAVIGTFLAALDATVVGTAMPTVVGQLGGLVLFPWVFSIYLLSSTATVPLYGKCADLFGRKRVYLVSVAVFLGGSLLCATSSTMMQLVLWRAVQGVGAGGVAPVTLTIVGDLYPPAQRARIQGLFSAVWAVSSVTGPALGALIVEMWSWQWIFLVNLPFGIVAAALMAWALREEVERRDHRLDTVGAVLLMAATTLVMWGMLRGGQVGFHDPWVWSSLTGGVVLGGLFIAQERRHPEPMIPPSLVRDPIIAVSSGAGVFAGAVLFGVSSYVPAFVQGVLGGGPAAAGAAVMPMGIGWPVASVLCGWVIPRAGLRRTSILGGCVLGAATTGLLFFTATMPRWLVMLDVGCIGLGMGFSMSALLIAAQEAVPRQRRGAATAFVQFSRTMGGALSVAALGAVLTGSLRQALGSRPELIEVANAIMDPAARAGLAAGTIAPLRATLGMALLRVLLGVGLCGLGACLVTLLYPRRCGDTGTAALPSVP